MSYLEMYNQDKIGELGISRNELWNSQKSQIKLAGFKADVLEKNDKVIQGGASINVYTPGWVNRREDFFAVPLLLGYLEIDKITTTRTWNDAEIDNTIIELVIANHDFKIFSPVSIVINDAYELNYAIQVINYLNDFIDQKGDINTIDLTKFSRDILKPLSRKYILSAIDNLNIECYADSVNRVGKENSFWNDFVITNLPKENYLRNVFEKILRENCQYFSSTNDIFTIKEYGDNEYAPAYERMKLEGEDFGQNYKEILRYETSSRLSLHELITSRIILTS